MNKLQAYKIFLKMVAECQAPGFLENQLKYLSEIDALNEQKKLEVEEALKTIADSKESILKLKEEGEKLSWLKQHKIDLESREKALNEKEASLGVLAETHDEKKAILKIEAQTLEAANQIITNRENAAAYREKVNVAKQEELESREKAIAEREEAHKKFIASVS